MTEWERELARHATCWPERYRNYFAADPDGADDQAWARMVDKGFAYVRREPGDPWSYRIYAVTQLGLSALEGAVP